MGLTKSLQPTSLPGDNCGNVVIMPSMTRDQLLAAELFAYRLANYADHLGAALALGPEKIKQETSIDMTNETQSIPPDDVQRKLALARPNEDQKLPHIGLAGDTYTIPCGPSR